jgi:hypothetical protein
MMRLHTSMSGDQERVSSKSNANLFLPSADYEVVAEGLGITFWPTPNHLIRLNSNRLLKGFLWHIWRPMTHDNDICDKCMSLASVTPMTCVTLWNKIEMTHCDIMWHFNTCVTMKVVKFIGPSTLYCDTMWPKKLKICQLGNVFFLEMTHYDIMWQFNTCVTQNVFKFIGPSSKAR